LITGKQEI
jgi:hypothetical protein